MSETFEQAAERLGHKLRRDNDGVIDLFALDVETHNGPECVLCEEMWCRNCTAIAKIEPCIGAEAHQVELAKWKLEQDRGDWARLLEEYGPAGPPAERQ